MAGSEGIVWLASFPKSGNTWFRIVLANLAAGDGGPVDINTLDRYCGLASSRDDFEAATMLDSDLLSHDDIDALRPPVYEHIANQIAQQHWMKVHDAYTALPSGEPLLGRAARAAIYMVRDPRDVAISFAHHVGTTIDEAIALLNRTDSVLSPGRTGLEGQLRQQLRSWSGHVTSWLDQADIPVHLVRYEDLIADAVAHFRRALAFVGHETGLGEIERAVRHADFSQLQRQERASGFAERQRGATPFFRAAKVGSWRNVLSPRQSACIENMHAAVMDRLGYARG